MRQDVYIYKDGVVELRRPRQVMGRVMTQVTRIEDEGDGFIFSERRWYKTDELHGIQVFKEI